MIRATELAGRAVIDIEAAERIGTIDKLILDPEGRRIAGFVVARAGSALTGGKSSILIPASAVHALGPDAVTVRQSAASGSDVSRLEALPRGQDVIGRKVVSEDGRFLGKVSDVLIERSDGQIRGYLLADHKPGRLLDEMLGRAKQRHQHPYLPADVKLRTGRDLIVTSEDAVSYDWTDEDLPKHEPAIPTAKWSHTISETDSERSEVHPAARPSGELDHVGGARETNPRVR
jgi:sporulation protein YlmC with PRC-barrel domain